MAIEFGSYPLHLTRDAEGNYAVDPQDAEVAEIMGVTPTFEPDRLEVMQARAYAHGYTFVYSQESETQS